MHGYSQFGASLQAQDDGSILITASDSWDCGYEEARPVVPGLQPLTFRFRDRPHATTAFMVAVDGVEHRFIFSEGGVTLRDAYSSGVVFGQKLELARDRWVLTAEVEVKSEGEAYFRYMPAVPPVGLKASWCGLEFGAPTPEPQPEPEPIPGDPDSWGAAKAASLLKPFSEDLPIVQRVAQAAGPSVKVLPREPIKGPFTVNDESSARAACDRTINGQVIHAGRGLVVENANIVAQEDLSTWKDGKKGFLAFVMEKDTIWRNCKIDGNNVSGPVKGLGGATWKSGQIYERIEAVGFADDPFRLHAGSTMRFCISHQQRPWRAGVDTGSVPHRDPAQWLEGDSLIEDCVLLAGRGIDDTSCFLGKTDTARGGGHVTMRRTVLSGGTNEIQFHYGVNRVMPWLTLEDVVFAQRPDKRNYISFSVPVENIIGWDTTVILETGLTPPFPDRWNAPA